MALAQGPHQLPLAPFVVWEPTPLFQGLHLLSLVPAATLVPIALLLRAQVLPTVFSVVLALSLRSGAHLLLQIVQSVLLAPIQQLLELSRQKSAH